MNNSDKIILEFIMVCGGCLRAKCYQGILDGQCNNFLGPPIKKTREELLLLNIEDSSYWKTEKEYDKYFFKTKLPEQKKQQEIMKKYNFRISQWAHMENYK